MGEKFTLTLQKSKNKSIQDPLTSQFREFYARIIKFQGTGCHQSLKINLNNLHI